MITEIAGIKAALRKAMDEATPAPPPPLASDVRMRGAYVPLPKAFLDSLGWRGPAMLQASLRSSELELRPRHIHTLRPRGCPDLGHPLESQGRIQEASRQILDELDEWSLITVANLNVRGLVALDQGARHRLGWQAGDRIRVVLEEGHLRLIRVA